MSSVIDLATHSATVVLSKGAVTVAVSLVGASLVHLSRGAMSVVPEVSSEDSSGRYLGSVIAPWPNRIEDGRYSFGGEEFDLECNEATRNNALHGFSAQQIWDIDTTSSQAVTLVTNTGGVSGYPWQISLQVTYRVEADGVSVTLGATNKSETPAPFGAAFHPYLRFPHGAPSDWPLAMAATVAVEPDRKRLLPMGERDVSNTELDFRQGRVVDHDFLDHAFGEFVGDVSAVLTDFDGSIIRIDASGNCGWMQVHKPIEGPLSGSVVLEPQTCPPNAFSTGRDIIVLEPGEDVTLCWRLRIAEGGGTQ